MVSESSFPEEREVIIGSNASFTVVGNEFINDELHIYVTDPELVEN